VDNDLDGTDPRQIGMLKENREGDWAWMGTYSNTDRPEKNWLPFIEKDSPKFLYSVDPLIIRQPLSQRGYVDLPVEHRIALDNERGSSQVLPFEGGYLFVTHSVTAGSSGKRIYRHRFIHMTNEYKIAGVSEPFYFNGKFNIEFCAGMCRQGDSLLLSYGFEDNTAWIVIIPEYQLYDILIPVDKFAGEFVL